MVSSKFIEIFGISNFISQHFFRISYILAGKLNFWFLEKRFRWIKLELLVKNGSLANSDLLYLRFFYWKYLKLLFLNETIWNKNSRLWLYSKTPFITTPSNQMPPVYRKNGGVPTSSPPAWTTDYQHMRLNE